MDSLDLNSIEKTELLASHAAKDKIMVKPKRMSARQSRKPADVSHVSRNQPLARLPNLTEEVLPVPKVTNGNMGTGAAGAKSLGNTIIPEETRPSASSSPSPTTPPSGEASPGVALGKLNLQFNTTTTREYKRDVTSPSSSSPSLLPSGATTASSPPFKAPSPTTPHSRFSSQKFGAPRSPETENQPASTFHASVQAGKATTLFASNAPDKKLNESGTHDVKQTSTKDDSIEVSSTKPLQINELDDIKSSSINKLQEDQKEPQGNKAETSIKNRMNQFQTPAVLANKFGPTTIPGRLPLKLTGLDPGVTSPTKEESKVKQWSFGKALPAAADSQNSVGAQKGNSYPAKISTSSLTKTPDLPSQTDTDKITPTSSSPTNLTSSEVRKLENVTMAPGNFSSLPAYGQPWRNRVRKKENENEFKQTDDIIQSCTPTSYSSGNKTLGHQKSVLMSASKTENKQSSFGLTSNINKDVSDTTSKEEKSSEQKHPNTDTRNNPNEKDNSTKAGSSTPEMSDINSVKAFRNLFACGSKSSNQKTNVTATLPSDRLKSLSTFSSASSASITYFPKPVSTQAAADGATSSPPDVSSVPTSDDVSQLHRGSAISAFTKPQESGSTVQKRGINFKGSSVFSQNVAFNQPFGASSSFLAPKTDTTFTTNSDNSGASSSSSLSKPVVNVFKLAQSSSAPPLQTSSATSPTYAMNVKSVHGDRLSKTTTNVPVPATTTTSSTSSVTPALAGAHQTATQYSTINNPSSTSSIAASNTPKPAFSIISNALSQTSSATSSTFIKPNSSLSSSASFKPQTFSTSSSSHPKHTPVQTLTLQTSIPQVSTKSTDKTSDKILEGKKSDLPAKVPVWRANLLKKEVNIETVDKPPLSSSPSHPGSEIINKFDDKDKISDPSKKSESLSGTDVILQVDMSPGKPSKVLNMIKNFQNITAPS